MQSSAFEKHDGDLNRLCSIVWMIEGHADIHKTARAWLEGVGGVDYTETICEFLDDAGLEYYANSMPVGTYGTTEPQMATLREFCEAFVMVADKYPPVTTSPADVLASPEWRTVVEKSRPVVAAWASWRAETCDDCYAKGWR